MRITFTYDELDQVASQREQALDGMRLAITKLDKALQNQDFMLGDLFYGARQSMTALSNMATSTELLLWSKLSLEVAERTGGKIAADAYMLAYELLS